MNARVAHSVVIPRTFVNGDGNTFSIVWGGGTACGMSTENITDVMCVCGLLRKTLIKFHQLVLLTKCYFEVILSSYIMNSKHRVSKSFISTYF